MKATILYMLIVVGLTAAQDPTKAVCKVSKDTGMLGSDVEGTVTFEQVADGVKVTVDLSGFSGPVGKNHGFHVHKNGSMDNWCGAADGHFNPEGVVHGGPTDTVRHVGDLGNVEEEEGGIVTTEYVDDIITLSGNNSIVGRAIVVHEGRDDLGKGGDDGSRKTGNAGKRMACCLVELDDGTSGAAGLTINHVLAVLVTTTAAAVLVTLGKL